MTAWRIAPLYLAAAAFAIAVSLPGGDPDTYWHLASGKWMVEHGQLLRSDVFSSTVHGAAYSVGEWLGELAIYGAYVLGGWAGIAVLRATLVAIGAFFITQVALRAAPAPFALAVTALALALSEITWTDRPQLFTFALFPLLLDLLVVARAGRTRLLVAVPPLVLVWTNLHGGYALGLALVAIFAAEAVLTRRSGVPFAAAAVLALVASFIDPGSLGLGAAAAHATSPPRFIVEEAPPDVLRPAGFVFAVFGLATLGLALARGGTLLDALLLVPLFWLGLSAQRHMPYFALAATPFIAQGLSELWWRWRPASRFALPRPVIVGVGAGLVAMVAASVATAPFAPDETHYPTAARATLSRTTGNLLNEYDWGGYLIWRVPERPVFIDGRLFLFLPDVLTEYEEMVFVRPGWRDQLDRHAIAQVLLRPDRPLVTALRDLGWTVVVEDATALLLQRPSR
ncbi:MAG TPA: hypothetical protein VGS01_01970 [Candidatus Limnocylindria bacterium]|nr:hypothetical protein [Candidatus Limnocylindria bacterium]